jgi:hypothetical protein
VLGAQPVPAAAAALTAPVPIGKACANTDAFAVTDEGGRVSKPGEAGEFREALPSTSTGKVDRPRLAGHGSCRTPGTANDGG